jgi:hypothetical protein
MPDRRHILPPQTTALERAVDQAMPAWDHLADLVEPASVRANVAFQPWLAVQWQVAQFAPYFSSVDELLTAALPWLFERGNAASLRRALGWLGYDNISVDEDGPYLHLDLGRIAAPEDMVAVAHVVRASLPAHVNFYRVFHGHDLRPIVLDQGPALDHGMLDGYSGIAGAAGLVVSFGERAGSTLPPATAGNANGAATHVRTSVARYDDMPVLDAWRLDSHVLAGVSGGVMELLRSSCNAPTPGGGMGRASAIASSAVPWLAPLPVGARAHHAIAQQPLPVHPAPRWGGPWGAAHGGPWEPIFWLISSEES